MRRIETAEETMKNSGARLLLSVNFIPSVCLRSILLITPQGPSGLSEQVNDQEK